MSVDTYEDVDRFLLGNARSAFKQEDGVPHTVKGTIVSVAKATQVRDYTTGKPKFYPDSEDPIMQLPVTFSTGEHDPKVVGDNGDRTVYFSGDLLSELRRVIRETQIKVRKGVYAEIEKTQEISSVNNKPKNVWKIKAWRQASGTDHTSADELIANPGVGGTEEFAPNGQGAPPAWATAPTYTTVPAAPATPDTSPQAATIAARLAAAQAAKATAPTENPLLAGLTEEQRKAVGALDRDTAEAADLLGIWQAVTGKT